MLRYVAKVTINLAIAHGIAHEVGSLEPGKLALCSVLTRDLTVDERAKYGIADDRPTCSNP